MPPRPLSIDWDQVMKSAREVAATEAMPSRTKLANRLGFVASTLNKRAAEAGKLEAIDGILQGGREIAAKEALDGTFASAANDPTPAPWKAEDVIRAHGDDPDECVILRQRGNRWGDPGEPMHQLRVDWIRKADLIQPVDPGSWKKPPKPKKPRHDRERDMILTSDHHCPLVDKTFHSLTLDLLADEQPSEGLIMGDLMDMSTVSRFRDKDGFAHSVQECLDSAFQVLRDYREASPNTKWSMLPGNHDCRLHYAIQDNVKALHQIAPAGETLPALNFRRLLHLDELGIDFIDKNWEAAKFPISRKLTARHGYTTAKNAGDKMLSSLTRSTVQGHSHRLSLTMRTEHDDDPDEPTSTRLAAEVGCMCEIHEGLGHAVDPNWQQGLMMVHIWPDGDFHLTPYFYVPGRLLGPGKRYQP